MASAGEDESTPRPTWAQILRLASPLAVPEGGVLRAAAAGSLLLTLIGETLSLLPPLAIRAAVKAVSEQSADAVVAPLCAYLALTMADEVLSNFGSALHVMVSSDVERRASTQMLAHVVGLGASFHRERNGGEVAGVVNRASGAVLELMDLFVFQLLTLAYKCVLVVGVFWHLGNIVIVLIVLCYMVILMAYVRHAWNIMMRKYRKSYKKHDAKSGRETESLEMHETVRVHGRTDTEVGIYQALGEDCRAISDQLTIWSSLLFFVPSIIVGFGVLCAKLFAASSVVYGEHRQSPEDYVLVCMYIGSITSPIQSLIYLYKDLGGALTALEKAVVLLMLEPEVVDKPDALDLLLDNAPSSGDIVFDNVSFGYKPSSMDKAGLGFKKDDTSSDSDSDDDGSSRSDGGDDVCENLVAKKERSDDEEKPPKVIKNLSFRIPPGHTVAIVGPSGSGKSTICRLLLRIYDVDEGRVLVGGFDVRDLKQNSLREAIGYVSQDTVLFNDTLRYNVQYGAKDASDAKVMDSLRAAALDSFLETHDEGLDYVVGSRGCKLQQFYQLNRDAKASGIYLRTAF